MQKFVALTLSVLVLACASFSFADDTTTPGYPVPNTPQASAPGTDPLATNPPAVTPSVPPSVTPMVNPVQLQPQLIATPIAPPLPPALLMSNADEMPLIYGAMMATRRFENMAGHTVAAAQLVGCLPGLTPVQKVQTMMGVLGALSRSNLRVVNEAFYEGICDNAQVTVIAAVLACKMGNRTPVAMSETLTASYREVLTRYRLVNELYQVEVAARLMQ